MTVLWTVIIALDSLKVSPRTENRKRKWPVNSPGIWWRLTCPGVTVRLSVARQTFVRRWLEYGFFPRATFRQSETKLRTKRWATVTMEKDVAKEMIHKLRLLGDGLGLLPPEDMGARSVRLTSSSHLSTPLPLDNDGKKEDHKRVSCGTIHHSGYFSELIPTSWSFPIDVLMPHAASFSQQVKVRNVMKEATNYRWMRRQWCFASTNRQKVDGSICRERIQQPKMNEKAMALCVYLQPTGFTVHNDRQHSITI